MAFAKVADNLLAISPRKRSTCMFGRIPSMSILAILRWLLLFYAKKLGVARRRFEPRVVLLLRESRELSKDIVRAVAQRAWGFDDQGDDWIVCDGSRFILHVGDYALLVTSGDEPYIEPRAVRTLDSQVETEKAFNEHNAWISVGVLPNTVVPDGERESCDNLITKLACALADNQNCLALYSPKSRQMMLNNPEFTNTPSAAAGAGADGEDA